MISNPTCNCQLFDTIDSYFRNTRASEIVEHLLSIVNLLNDTPPMKEFPHSLRKELIYEISVLIQWILKLREAIVSSNTANK